jgi:ParB-like chromosome segregation protein Spo0J
MKHYQHEIKKVSDLIPYINNSRTHSDEQTTQIASSIKEFGFTNPVLIDESGGLIAGHGRLMAAKKLDLKEVPCIVLSGLTESQKKAYIITDNQLPLNAGWDLDKLKLEIDTLSEMDFNLDLLGFDDQMLETLTNDIEINFEEATEEEQGQLDTLDEKLVNCPSCNNTFNSRGNEC